MRPKSLFAIACLIALFLDGCMPLPMTGSGQLVFEETTVHVSVRDCIREAVFTEETRAAVQASNALDGFRIVFHAGPTRYVGAGLAEVRCDEAAEIPRLAEIDRRARE